MDVCFLSRATGLSADVCEMKLSTAVVAIFKYNLLTVQSNKSQSIWLTLVISPFLPSQLFIFDCSLGETFGIIVCITYHFDCLS